MKEKKTILLAMKKCPQLDNIEDCLKRSFYNVIIAGTAKAITIALDHGHHHLLLIDINLPGLDDLAIIRNIRKSYEIPIIMLSESKVESVIVDALDSGANDVLVLPFGRPEHMARIRAALRLRQNTYISDEIFSVAGLTINHASRTVDVNGKRVHLTPIEFRIMAFLTRNAGKVLTHEQIITEIWGPYNSDNLVLRVNMANIRRKIEPNPAEPKYIITEVGVGYRAVSE